MSHVLLRLRGLRPHGPTLGRDPRVGCRVTAPDAIRRAAAELDLLSLLGGDFRRVAATRGGEWAGPCPVCRSGKDRLRAWPAADPPRAWCRKCGSEGDALRWALLLEGRDPSAPGETGRWLRERGHDLAGCPPPLRPRPRPRLEPPARLPSEEVAATWAASVRVTAAPPVTDWLRLRGLDPAAVERLDLARALPLRGELPAWAMPWRRSGHLAVLAVYDAAGRLTGLRARDVTGRAEPAKELAPRGQASRGVVYASPAAVAMLRGEAEPARVVVLEGWPDFATWATRRPELAALGIYAGAWAADLAARIPSGAEVIVRAHADDAGRRYAAAVAESVAGRCAVRVLASRVRGVG